MQKTTKRMVTKEEVDQEIMKLKKKRNNGEGLDTDLYNLKIKGLETVKDYVKEKEEWTRLQEA